MHRDESAGPRVDYGVGPSQILDRRASKVCLNVERGTRLQHKLLVKRQEQTTR